MFEMTLPEPFRKQCLDLLFQNLLAAIAKQPLRLLIDQNDLAFGVDNHNRVGSRLQKAAKLCLSSFRYGAGSLLIKQMGAFSLDRGFAYADEVILQICLSIWSGGLPCLQLASELTPGCASSLCTAAYPG